MHVRGTTLVLKPSAQSPSFQTFFKAKTTNKSNFVIFLRKREESNRDLRDVDLEAQY